MQSATALGGASDAVVGNAAVNAIVAVLHAQDGEELPVLPDAVPGVEEPAGHRGKCHVKKYL